MGAVPGRGLGAPLATPPDRGPQGTGPEGPPPGAPDPVSNRPPAPGEPPPDAPATVEEVRDLRRWLWVAGLWAVAASVIALIALFTDDPSSPRERRGSGGDGRASSARVEQLSDRVDGLEQRVREARSQGGDGDDSEALADLDDRVGEVEGRLDELQSGVDDQGESIGDMQDEVDDLGRRVEDLEAQQEDQGPP